MGFELLWRLVDVEGQLVPASLDNQPTKAPYGVW